MIQHIYPLNDLEPHDIESGGTCKCEPRVEFVEGDTVFIHNAFDGRDIIERLEAGEDAHD